MSAKVLAFAEHAAIAAAVALVTALSPYLDSPGLSHVTAGQWQGVADHVLAALVLVLGALVGTPLTRKYGVGSTGTVLASSAPVGAPAEDGLPR